MSNSIQIGSIKMIGDFSYYDRHNVLASIFVIANTLRPYLPIDDGFELFKTLFPEIILTASYTLVGDAFVNDNGTVDGYPGRFSVLIATHEWGHLFDMALPYEYRPSTLLCQEGIKDDSGQLLTGPLGNLYNRDCGLKAPDNGRLSDDWRVGHQVHPRDWEKGNNPTDDWSDLWLALMFGWFLNNSGGQTRKRWVQSHMVDWIKLRIA